MSEFLVALNRMSNSFKPDVKIMVKMSVLSSLLTQLFLLHSNINGRLSINDVLLTL